MYDPKSIILKKNEKNDLICSFYIVVSFIYNINIIY